MKVIITGATKGIGAATLKAFLAIGADVAINARNEADLKAIQTTCKKEFPNQEVLIKVTDMSKKEAVLEFAEFVKKTWKQVDVLVNNAGVFLPGEITKEEDGTLESQIETNLYSAYHLTRAILPLMKPKKSGHIFNLCSVASLIAYPNGGSYSISKFALLGFTKVLRAELMESGIKVTAIMPGATWSASWEGVDLPKERLMAAKDIADAIVGAYNLGPSAVVEEIILRPQLGDL